VFLVVLVEHCDVTDHL